MSVVTFLLAGCDQPHSEPGSAGQPTLAMLEWTIGGESADSDHVFDVVTDLLVTRDGTLWVLDGGSILGSPMIRRYGPSGNFLGEVAGRGDGPGEFRHPFAMAELGDGRVVVRDRDAAHRMNVYQPDGSHDTTWTHDPPLRTIAGALDPLRVDAQGIVWVLVSEGPARGPVGRSGPAPTFYVRLSQDGAVLDSVWPPAAPPTSAGVFEVAADGRVITPPLPFQPRSFRAWSPAGLFATGVTSDYAVEMHAPGAGPGMGPDRGAPVAVLRRGAPPVPTEAAERAAWGAWMSEQVAEQGGAASTSPPAVPQVKPPLRGVGFGADGRLWVQVSMPSGAALVGAGWDEPLGYDVFEWDGAFAYLGRVVLPLGVCRQARAMVRRGDTIWCVARVEHDVEVLQRVHIGDIP